MTASFQSVYTNMLALKLRPANYCSQSILFWVHWFADIHLQRQLFVKIFHIYSWLNCSYQRDCDQHLHRPSLLARISSHCEDNRRNDLPRWGSKKSVGPVDWPAVPSERHGCDSPDGAALCPCARGRMNSGGHSACHSICAGTGFPTTK